MPILDPHVTHPNGTHLLRGKVLYWLTSCFLTNLFLSYSNMIWHKLGKYRWMWALPTFMWPTLMVPPHRMHYWLTLCFLSNLFSLHIGIICSIKFIWQKGKCRWMPGKPTLMWLIVMVLTSHYSLTLCFLTNIFFSTSWYYIF